jgi:hypothetical protein
MIGNLPLSRSTPDPNQEGTLTVWSNVWEKTNGSILFDTTPFASSVTSQDSSIPKCHLPNPHSSAVLDFDGDCLADLFLTCQDPQTDHLTYQIWLNDPAGEGFKLGKTGPLPKGAGMVSFADMGTLSSIALLSI